MPSGRLGRPSNIIQFKVQAESILDWNENALEHRLTSLKGHKIYQPNPYTTSDQFFIQLS